jgi:predicted phage-related endonuclease
MLTATQIEARKGRLTASRVACLMTGDAPEIMQLYREMTGEARERDLSDVWAVQLGAATEPLNLQWYHRRTGTALLRYGDVAIHAVHDWAAATLDAWDPVRQCPVECKHVGGREPLDVVIGRYQPQLQWQMEVTGASKCAVSVIMGASEPTVDYIPRDVEYAAEMVRRGAQFMDCVARRVDPVTLPPVPPPIDASRIYDMTGNNQWSDAAMTWLLTRGSARDCAEAEKFLKSIVPADARKVTGHGVSITRDRAGRLSLREVV